jgi:hypothetical protein
MPREVPTHLERAYLILVHVISSVGGIFGSLQVLKCGAELLGERRGLLCMPGGNRVHGRMRDKVASVYKVRISE